MIVPSEKFHLDISLSATHVKHPTGEFSQVCIKDLGKEGSVEYLQSKNHGMKYNSIDG